MEVRVLEPPLGTIEGLVAVAPGVVGSIGTPIRAGHGDPRAQRPPRPADRHDAQTACVFVVATVGGHDLLLVPPEDVDYPERDVAGFVRDVRDTLAIARPAWRRRIELAVRKRERIAALARHEPELIPLPAEVRAVHDARAIGRPIGAPFPRRLFIAQLAQRSAGSRLHAPEPDAAVDVASVRDEDDLFPIGRPRG